MTRNIPKKVPEYYLCHVEPIPKFIEFLFIVYSVTNTQTIQKDNGVHHITCAAVVIIAIIGGDNNDSNDDDNALR